MTVDSTASQAQRGKAKSEKNCWFRLYASIVIPIMYALARFEIVDGHKLPKQGALVITPNHSSEIDPLVIAVVVYRLGRAPRFLAKESLFRVPVVGWALRKTKQIKVHRNSKSASSEPLHEAQQITDQKSVVIVYPEGTLTREPDLWPMRGKTGAVRLARAANIPIVPVAHWGTNELMPRYGKKIQLFKRPTIRVIFGDPYTLDEIPAGKNSVGGEHDTDLNSAQEVHNLKRSTEFVMNKIVELLATLRQETPPAKLWDPTENNQQETGKF